MRLLALLVCVLLVAGCAPRLSPPYRDYEVRMAADDSLSMELREALTDSGWTVEEKSSPGIVSTQTQEIASGLLSTTYAALDLVPLSGDFVRVYVRAESRNVLGGRTKVYALNGRLREAVYGPLSESLRQRGLVPLGTPRDRDEDATDED
ncbi:MAG: hypothetical protein AAGK21_14400 [Bacteroidota bacterium]